MNETDLDYLRAMLLTHKSEILNMTSEFKNEKSLKRENIPDENEAASLDLHLTVSINLHEKHRAVLIQIERALAKIENGTYNRCEICSDSISLNRLRASPFTTMCIACKEEQEDPRNFLQ